MIPATRCLWFVGRGASPLAFCVVALALLNTSSAPAQQDEDRLEIKSLHVGFDGVYKLGCWAQLDATLGGGDEVLTGQLVVRVLDTDGVPTQVVSPPGRPVGVTPGQTTTARLFFRQGQANGRIAVQFVVDGRVRAERQFRPGSEPDGVQTVPYARSATSRILLTYGPMYGLATLVAAEEDQLPDAASIAASVDDPSDLPLEWIGYESIDTVMLATSQPELYRSLRRDSPRITALREWVERGGRLAIYCGANAPELIGPGGPLAELVPGEFSNDMLPVSERGLQSLENFTSASREETLPREQSDVVAPKLANVRGRILAYDGQRPSELPLVVRGRLGLGQVTFVAIDPNSPPFRDWPARTEFLKHTLDWSPEPPSSGNVIGLAEGNDLVGQLRSALDTKFQGVKTAPFALVAFLVLAYIVWIGPVDYFIVRRLLKRMEATWITFPLFVVVASAAAYWLAHWMKGDQLRVNQVEIVDVDVVTGLARGTVWTHYFSPRVELYDLSLQPKYLGDQTPIETEEVAAWLGLPGLGLGGMQGQGSGPRIPRGGYEFTPELDRLIRMPVQEWSTKTITARWSGRVQSGIEASLRATGDGLLEGEVANRTGVALDECVLLHGNWAYRLTKLDSDAPRLIDSSLQPRQASTVLTNIASGDSRDARTDEYGTVVYDPLGVDVARICKTMMFYELVGGKNYTDKLNRYQSFIDLSRLLAGKQAILLARAPADAGSTWQNKDQALSSDQDQRWLYYRFLIPLE